MPTSRQIDPDSAWHAAGPQACLERLQSSWGGLDEREAIARRQRYGANRLPAKRAAGPIGLFVRQFRSPLIYLLLIAAAVSAAIGEAVDAAFILGVLLLNAVIGALQEWRAGSSAQALQRLIRQVARVRRPQGIREIDAEMLVPGDVIEVESGMHIAADARLLEAQHLLVDEAALTGESMPVRKQADAAMPMQAGLGDRPTLLHAGTIVAEGRGVAVVVGTGTETALGRIAGSLVRAPDAPPPLVLRLERFSRSLALYAVVAIAVVAAVQAAQGVPAAQIFFFAVALAVSAIPEGLPIAVTVALAAATRRMARRQVIVRTLPAVEGLGACTLIASDKTGTLTLNRLSVERVMLPDRQVVGREGWARRDDVRAIAWSVALCNDASFSPDGTAVGDTVDIALLAFARELGIDGDALRKDARRIAAMPYEPARKFAAVAVSVGGRQSLHVKGAAETVLAMCRASDQADGQVIETLTRQGFRVLAVAAGDLDGSDPSSDVRQPQGLRLLGYVGLLDPLRPEVPAAIASCQKAGIRVCMVTGDHPSTALTIARLLGFADSPSEVVTGAEIVALAGDQPALASRIARAGVFARVEPTQKLTIVDVLQSQGELVAVTGDGVNDAPALRAAHIGVAMGRSGTDVARGAADLILADDNFASIVGGIEEGRIAYANIRRIVIVALVTGLAEIGLVMGALLAGLPVPLTAVQLLWLNVVTNGIQDVALGFGRGEGDELDAPPRRPEEPLIDRRALLFMLLPAVYMAASGLLLFQWQLERGATVDAARNLVLFATVVFQNVYVLAARSERRSILATPLASNPWLLAGVSGALALQVAAQYVPVLRDVLGTQPLSGEDYALSCLAAAGLVGCTEIVKLLQRIGAVSERATPSP